MPEPGAFVPALGMNHEPSSYESPVMDDTEIFAIRIFPCEVRFSLIQQVKALPILICDRDGSEMIRP
jgi:hypothetical protein